MSSSLFQLKNQHALTVDKCKEQIELAKNENKIFLRQALQSRLVNLLNLEKNFSQAAFYHLSNLTKARASLTNARTIANSKYTPPAMQAKLDLQSGILHAADDHDFKTAFSYFYEAFEAFDSVSDSNMAQKALKYMLLSKIMTDNSDEVASILSGKTVSKYSGPEIDAMRALANAAKQHTMFEKELSRLIQPYSCVQIDHIAKSVGLDRERVERKLSQMILDKKFYGCLQGDGILVIYEKETVDPSFELAIESIHAIGEVVDALGERAKKVK